MELANNISKLVGRFFTGLFFIFILNSFFLAKEVSASDSIPVNFKFSKTFLLDIAKNKNRLISVGERGLVFSSSNEGESWKCIQIIDKPTLTSIVFLNNKTAIAVGHRGSVYRTENSGKDFIQVNLPELKNDDSLLRIRVVDENHIVIVGAWGLFLESTDNGKTWERQQIISSGFDWHLYDVVNSPFGLIAVGEAGTVILRKNKEKNWEKIDSKYKGSYFGIVKSKENSFFIYGMRGNIFEFNKSNNNHEPNKYTWRKFKTNSSTTWMSGLALKNDSILFFGDGGIVGEKTTLFSLKTVPLKIVNAGVELNNGAVFLVGLNGGFSLN